MEWEYEYDEWKYEYDIKLICESNKEYLYSIQADNADDAIAVAIEFFSDDYPYETVTYGEIIERREVE